MSVRVIAYTYESDVHCPACAYKCFAPSPHQSVPLPGLTDEHGIPYRAVDLDGNPIHPVFNTDEHDFTHCGTCGEEL
jgi:hypothetical protein